MSNETYKQLMLWDSGADDDAADREMTADQQIFLEVHKQIIYHGNLAVANAVSMARHLKTMRDDRLYIAAGFDTFGEYTEDALNVKERQAYNYISIVENLPANFLQSNADLGITKLLLLTDVDAATRDTLVDSGIAEDSTAKELQSTIAALKAELEEKNEQLTFFQNKADKDTDDEVDVDFATEEEFAAIKQSAVDLAEARAAEAAAEAEKAIEKERKKAEKLTADKDKLAAEKDRLAKELAELKAAPPETVSVDKPETLAKVEELEKKLVSAESTLAAVEKQMKVTSDPELARFKFLFESWQAATTALIEQLKKLPDDVGAKMHGAIKKVLEVSEL